MIVEPDFLDHWKTRLLVQRTGDESAPLMVLRLWGHCQSRRKWRFEHMNGEVLAAICRSKIEGENLKTLFTECGFIDGKNGAVCVHHWEVSNRSLVSAWKNGSKGGRPKKTDRIPTGKPTETDSKPTHLSSLSYLSVLKTEGVRGRFKEWVEVRKAQGKAPKNWDKMFAEQCRWLEQYPENTQMEILSYSIRNNYQGLHEPKGGQHGTNSKHPAESSRNIGTTNEGKSGQYEGIGKVR